MPDAELWGRPRVVNVNLHGDSGNYCNNNGNYWYNNKWQRRNGSNINVRGKSITLWQRAAQGFCRLPPSDHEGQGVTRSALLLLLLSCRVVPCRGMTRRVVITIVNCSCITFSLCPFAPPTRPRGSSSSCCMLARLSPA